MAQNATDRADIRAVGAEHGWQLLDAGNGGDMFHAAFAAVIVYYDENDAAVTAIYKEDDNIVPGGPRGIGSAAVDAKTKAITWLSNAHKIERAV